MRYVLTRQLIAPTVATASLFASLSALTAEPREAGIGEEFRAARRFQNELSARGAAPEEWRRLDETYAALVARLPRDSAVRAARAEALWAGGEQARAMTEWEQALQLDPRNTSILAQFAGGALALGDARKSADYYSRALEIEPNDATLHFALANVWFLFRHELLDTDHPDAESLLTGALVHFAEAARLAPTNADYARNYAETFYIVPRPDWKAALAAWEHLETLSAQPDFALVNQARVNLRMGQPGAAQRCLSRIQSTEYQWIKSRLATQAAAAIK